MNSELTQDVRRELRKSNRGRREGWNVKWTPPMLGLKLICYQELCFRRITLEKKIGKFFKRLEARQKDVSNGLSKR